MKIFRNRIFIGLICIVLALAIIFFAAPAVISEQIKTTEVVTATTNIEAGTVISEEMLKTVRIPVSIVPGDATNQAASIGKYTASTIWAGDVITAAKLTDTNTQEDTYELATAKGKMVVSVTVKNLSVMAAARIRSGDVVTVMALLDGIYGSNDNAISTGIDTSATTPVPSAGAQTSETSDTSTDVAPVPAPTPIKDVREIEPTVVVYPELKYMEIAAIVASEGENAKVDIELKEDDENAVPVTISFYATEDQARRLAELEMNGTIYIAFVARGEEAFAFIPVAEKVLQPEIK